MYAIVFAVGFSLNIGLALYLVANERTHAQPWRFFAAAMATLLLAYGFDMGAQWINGLARGDSALRASSDSLNHLAKLTNLICGAFAGALASVAITNRAKAMHDSSSKNLLEELARLNLEKQKLHRLLKQELQTSSHDPGDITLQKRRVEAAQQLLGRLEENEIAATSKLRELGIGGQLGGTQSAASQETPSK